MIDHTPRRRAAVDVARQSLILAGQSPADAARMFRNAIYWVAIYADASLSLAQGIRGELALNVRNTRQARRAARAARFN